MPALVIGGLSSTDNSPNTTSIFSILNQLYPRTFVVMIRLCAQGDSSKLYVLYSCLSKDEVTVKARCMMLKFDHDFRMWP